MKKNKNVNAGKLPKKGTEDSVVNFEEKLEKSNKLYYGLIALVIVALIAIALILHYVAGAI